MGLRILKRTALLCSLTGILWLGGTAAFFSSFDKKDNPIAVGKNETEIEEEFPDPGDLDEREDPRYEKEVRISNRTSGESGFNVDCFVRAAVSFSNDDVGRAVTLTDLDTENWTFNKADGFYYYRRKLREGESTTPLFTGVFIETAKMDPLYKQLFGEFQIYIYEESIQAGDFQDYRSAWEYYLSPVAGV